MKKKDRRKIPVEDSLSQVRNPEEIIPGLLLFYQKSKRKEGNRRTGIERRESNQKTPLRRRKLSCAFCSCFLRPVKCGRSQKEDHELHFFIGNTRIPCEYTTRGTVGGGPYKDVDKANVGNSR